MSSQGATTDAGRGGTIGGRYRAFINLHEIAWELAFAALAVIFVALAFVPVDAGSRAESVVELAEWVITGMFVLEFGSRLFVAPDRGGYLRGHWVDLVGLVPPTRWLRPFRLLRLLRLIRAFAGVGRALVHVDRLARHRGLIWLLIAWLAVMMLCSIGLYIAEKGANAAVDSPLDALWWGITTMTTVGYGDVYPVTPEGRLAAAVLMVLGIGLFSAVTATVTSFLIGGRDSSSALAVDLERLAALHSGGQLSDDEFVAAKTKLLDQLPRAVASKGVRGDVVFEQDRDVVERAAYPPGESLAVHACGDADGLRLRLDHRVEGRVQALDAAEIGRRKLATRELTGA